MTKPNPQPTLPETIEIKPATAKRSAPDVWAIAMKACRKLAELDADETAELRQAPEDIAKKYAGKRSRITEALSDDAQAIVARVRSGEAAP